MKKYIIQVWDLNKSKTLSNLNCFGNFTGFKDGDPQFGLYGKEYKTEAAAKSVLKRIESYENPHWVLHGEVREVER